MNDHTQPVDQAMRDNKGKPELFFILGLPNAMAGVAHVFQHGAMKYARDDWKRGFPFTKVASSLLRHLFKWMNGEDVDPDPKMGGALHIDEVCWNALVLAEMCRTHPQFDDRIMAKVRDAAKKVVEAHTALEVNFEELMKDAKKESDRVAGVEIVQLSKQQAVQMYMDILVGMELLPVNQAPDCWERTMNEGDCMTLGAFKESKYNCEPILSDRGLRTDLQMSHGALGYCVYLIKNDEVKS